MKNLFFAFLSLFLIFSLNNISAQSKKGKKKNKQTNESVKKENKKETIQPYGKVIKKSAISDEGLFIVHKVEDNQYYEIPDSLFGREMLMVTRISKTASGIGFGGGKQNTQVLRWERKNKKVLLRVVSHQIVASDSLPIHEAVVNSNFEPILYSFDIKAIGKDSNSTVIQVNKFFEEDVKAIGYPLKRRKAYKISGIDKTRCYIESIKSYPLNIESRHVKTYKASDPPSNSSTGSISMELNNSMVLLPVKPMRRRYFDQRVGWFSRSQTDYGLENQKSKSVRYLDRWKLEVKKEDIEKFKKGELVEPKKQIVYYIDRATPKKWIPYLKQGIEDWQIAFEEAGFKNAIIAKDPPSIEEDPDWSPEDVRYSVVRYLASPIPNANGPHVSDPRSGEILESDINWYHNVMLLLRNWFFIQTAAINPEARTPEFRDEVMGSLIRFVSAHEVGHTLGLPHNMGSSSAYPVDSLRSVHFTKKYGTAPSIMDYARFNYVAQPEDKGVSLMPNVGIYDKHSIRWGYRPILDAKSAKDEKPILDQWIRAHEKDPMYRFGSQQFGNPIDPSSQTEDLGDDAIKASLYGIENLKKIVPNLNKWTYNEGEDFQELEDLYAQIFNQYNRYMGHVIANIGGVYENYKTFDQSGSVYSHVVKNHQKQCMKFLNEQLFKTPAWLINKDISNKIEFTGLTERIRKSQSNNLKKILDFARLARIIENNTVNDKESYSLIEMLNDLQSGIWSELRTSSAITVYRRNLQKAYIERMDYLINKKQSEITGIEKYTLKRTKVNINQSDIISVCRGKLEELKSQIKKRLPSYRDEYSKYHLKDMINRIDSTLESKD
ncbi:MAG: zinc-dependent metalloprotease [Parvicellaceae bacterium]